MGTPRNPDLLRYVASHLLAVVAEWAVFIVVLVYVFDRGGARATGFASAAMLVPYVLFAPYAGALAERKRPDRVRLGGMAAQTIGYGFAAVAALNDAPAPLVVGGCMLGIGAVATIRPAGAVLLPAIVRSSRELSLANMRVGICDSVAVLAGPLFATALLAIDGPNLALGGIVLLVASATAVASPRAITDLPAAHHVVDQKGGGSIRHLMTSVQALRQRPGAAGVLGVAGGQYVLVGALDIIMVVTAGAHLDLGESGAGLLSTLVGSGALIAAIGSPMLLNRRRLAPCLLIALLAIIGATIAFGLTLNLAAALILLPILGLSRSALDVLSRMLLQRSAPPNQLAAVFAVLELCSGAGMVIGSVFAQILIGFSGVKAAMIGLGVLFSGIVVAAWRSLRVADDGADVPVVAMSLLRRIPAFSPLPPLALESLARGALEVAVSPGTVVVQQGDHGDRFYAVTEGSFDVTMSGVHIRNLGRGASFGEVALLADVPRTATVTATHPGSLLAIERGPFLIAVTGHDSSRQAAWGAIRTLQFDVDVDLKVIDPAITSDE